MPRTTHKINENVEAGVMCLSYNSLLGKVINGCTSLVAGGTNSKSSSGHLPRFGIGCGRRRTKIGWRFLQHGMYLA